MKVLYEYNGKQVELGEIAECCGISKSTLYRRIHKQGMTLKEATETPVRAAAQYAYHGELLMLKQISERVKLDADTIRTRMTRYNISAQEAADDQFERGKYRWHGESVTLEEVAILENVDLKLLKSAMKSRNDIMLAVRIARKGRETQKAKKLDFSNMEIAEKLISQIVNEPKIEKHSDGSFRAHTRHYEIAVVFPRPGEAVMTASWEKTGSISMLREYKINNGVPIQVKGISG